MMKLHLVEVMHGNKDKEINHRKSASHMIFILCASNLSSFYMLFKLSTFMKF